MATGGGRQPPFHTAHGAPPWIIPTGTLSPNSPSGEQTLWPQNLCKRPVLPTNIAQSRAQYNWHPLHNLWHCPRPVPAIHGPRQAHLQRGAAREDRATPTQHLSHGRRQGAVPRARRVRCSRGGVFAQRGHSARTAPIMTVIIQVTTLKTTHLQNHAQSIQNSKIQTSDACHGSQGPKFCPL